MTQCFPVCMPCKFLSWFGHLKNNHLSKPLLTQGMIFTISPAGGSWTFQTLSVLLLTLASPAASVLLISVFQRLLISNSGPFSFMSQAKQNLVAWEVPREARILDWWTTLCSQPEGGALVWKVSSHLLKAILYQGEGDGWPCQMPQCFLSLVLEFVLDFLSSGCCSFSAGLYCSQRGVMVHLLLTLCLCWGRRACRLLFSMWLMSLDYWIFDQDMKAM